MNFLEYNDDWLYRNPFQFKSKFLQWKMVLLFIILGELAAILVLIGWIIFPEENETVICSIHNMTFNLIQADNDWVLNKPSDISNCFQRVQRKGIASTPDILNYTSTTMFFTNRKFVLRKIGKWSISWYFIKWFE
jgi:hypothetical protein